MYRLLIVTGNQNVKDMFAAMEGWETMGFKPPRLRESMDEAVECMHKHHIDAIALDEGLAFDGLRAYLDEQYPNLPIFSIETSSKKQLETIREVSSLLTRLRADDSNDEYDDAYRFGRQREHWMKKVLSGMIASAEDMRKQLCLYRCTEKMDVPCVLARIALPQDDRFMEDRWHYGSERLEVALRNFFGSAHDHMILHVAVVSPQEVRVLCYPESETDGLSENAAYEYIQGTVEQIAHYLGLEMKVLDVRRVPGLGVFAMDGASF